MENMARFPVLQLRCALILRELNQIFIAYLFKGGQEQSFFLQKLLFTAFFETILKILTYALLSTWSSVSSGYEHVLQLMQPCLRVHLKSHSGEKSFKCNQCDSAYVRASALRVHRKIHIGEKSYKCDQCDFASSRADCLKTHSKTHSGEKSHKCNLWSFASAYADS